MKSLLTDGRYRHRQELCCNYCCQMKRNAQASEVNPAWIWFNSGKLPTDHPGVHCISTHSPMTPRLHPFPSQIRSSVPLSPLQSFITPRHWLRLKETIIENGIWSPEDVWLHSCCTHQTHSSSFSHLTQRRGLISIPLIYPWNNKTTYCSLIAFDSYRLIRKRSCAIDWLL